MVCYVAKHWLERLRRRQFAVRFIQQRLHFKRHIRLLALKRQSVTVTSSCLPRPNCNKKSTPIDPALTSDKAALLAVIRKKREMLCSRLTTAASGEPPITKIVNQLPAENTNDESNALFRMTAKQLSALTLKNTLLNQGYRRRIEFTHPLLFEAAANRKTHLETDGKENAESPVADVNCKVHWGQTHVLTINSATCQRVSAISVPINKRPCLKKVGFLKVL
jgi:hypothetical protein